MNQLLHRLALVALFLLSFASSSMAQSRLIHYWNFNNYNTRYNLPSIPGLKANFSTIDTNLAQVHYAKIVSSVTDSAYIDPFTPATTDYDTINLRMGDTAGNALRLRNPSDSMSLVMYLPTYGYRNIKLIYASQRSSNGMLQQVFDYSLDSGRSWATTGLSIANDSPTVTFKRTTVSFSSITGANNNRAFVFRMRFLGNTVGTSGNNRIDNITLEGDSIITAGTISGGTNVCVAGTTSLTSTVSGGSWSSSSTAIATVSSSGTVYGVSTGTVIISYTITTSCCGTAISTYTVSCVSAATAGTVSGGATLLCDSAVTTMTSTVSGGSWSSSNTAVATVNPSTGMVAAVGAGSAIISYTVTTSCGTAYDTIMVTVGTTPSAGTISGVSSLCVGTLDTFATTVAGGSFTSSTTSVATVGSSSGIVSALAAGTTVITYAVTNSCGTGNTTATVTVIAAPVAGTISGPTRVCRGDTIALASTVTGGTWTSSNTALATVNAAGNVFGVAVGSLVISYTVTNSCGSATTTYSMIVNPADSCLTGVAPSLTNNNTISIFPNPAQGACSIALPYNVTEATITLLDMCGAVVLNENRSNIANHTATIALPSEAQGLYTVRIIANGQVYMSKLIIHNNN